MSRLAQEKHPPPPFALCKLTMKAARHMFTRLVAAISLLTCGMTTCVAVSCGVMWCGVMRHDDMLQFHVVWCGVV